MTGGRGAPSGTGAASPGWLAFGALIMGAAFWGGTWPAGRLAYLDVPPITLALLRWVVAGLLLTPFCLGPLIRQRAAVRAEGRRLVITSTLGVAAFTALIFIGLRTTTAINGALFNAATPVYIIVLSLFGVGERSNWKEAAGAAISFCGLVIIVTRGHPVRILSLEVNPGDIWILSALVLWALYNIVLRSWQTKLTPFIFLYSQVLIGVVLLAPFAALEWALGAHIRWTEETILAVAYLGTGSSIGAYAFWIYGVKRVGTARSILFQYFIPVFAAIFAMIFIGESLYLYHLAGVALIAAGIMIANRMFRIAGRMPRA